MKCPVMSFEVYGFGVTLGSLYINAELVWYVLFWNLLALGWSLVSVQVWRLMDELFLINVPWSQKFSGVLRFWI